ncbi:MAG: pilus assembly protein PilP [Candidatus Electrothrix sp. GW3-4]|uniref:pilus assembly protein PilP n=1 Tax=Candidatus Electrothrix sp. GW3-4 TaxID=3126740 RepID=UPI0030D1F199
MKLIVKRCILSVVTLFVFGVARGVVWAAETDFSNESKQAEEGQNIRDVDKFQYKFEDRPDPFLPFLSQDRGRDELDESPIDEGEGKALTGMQLFEPGQLRLVALLKIGNKNVAMAEDIAGKGYRLDENMLIGRHGIINRITEEQVEITESYKTKTGRVVTKEIIMRLKKEGDK